MDFFTGETLQLLIEKDKKKSEGLLPELIKRLILSSSPSVSNIRMPGLEDIWAPGFDGIVNCKEATTYVADGISVWECGTNVDSLKKINEDYEKRTRNSLGINKASTTFYFVVPKIWAYNNQGMPISKWESEHKNGWREVCVYDASVLSDWIKSEPAVCAWLIEQYGENKHTDFATVEGAWETFSNLTNPPLSHSMFLEGRQNETADFQNKCKQKMCRIRSAYFMDAYGFCLSSLIQNKEMSHQVIVVNNEDTYLELTRFLKGKTFLLSFPFSGKVSDCNATIVCYSKEATSYGDMIELPALWKTQYTKALRDMGLSDTQASECYLFTHGNLLSLVRRIPGNAASSRPKWADAPDIELLYPLVFMHQFSTTNDLEKTVVSDIAGVAYAQLESKYESFLRMEDAPLKKVGDFYYLVNFEEAWRTLQVDASDVMSSKMQDTIITLLSACEKNNEFQSQPLESIIRRLLYNYIYFSETGSEQKVIDDRVIAIFECAKTSISSSVVLKSLADLAEASPTETMSFIESQLINGVVNQAFSESNSWSGSYHYVLWALDKLVQYEESAIRACRVLCGLCLVPSEYHTGNSPKESLLNALCLWDDHSAIKLDEKTRIAIKLIDDNSVFGVPFAIELISKESVFRGVRIGEKERRFGGITPEGFRQARGSIGSKIIGTSIQENRADWLGKLLDVYWCVPSEVLSSAAELLLRASFCPKEKVHLILQLRRHLFYNEKNDRENRIRWDEALEKWLNYLTTEDPTSQEGWRFYKYHETPFPELLSDDIKTDYIKRLELAEEIRQKTFADVRSKFGSDAIFRLAKCMEDIGAISLPPYLKRDTLLDYIVRNEKELIADSTRESFFLEPQKELLSNNQKQRIKALIMLATEIRIPAKRAIQFGIDRAINDMIRCCKQPEGSSVIEKDYSVYCGDSSGYEFVCNSKYWIIRALSAYANSQTSSIETISDAYLSIIHDNRRFYSDDVKFYQISEPYYFFDHIQVLFNHRWFPNSSKLMNAIYDKLLPVLSNSFQFLHQKAKGKLVIAQVQVRYKRFGEAKRSLNDALINIVRAIDLAKQYPEAKNIDETLLHMIYTKGRILIEYSCISSRRVPLAVETCYELYDAQKTIREDAYDFVTGVGNDKKSFDQFIRILTSDQKIRKFQDLNMEKAESLLLRWTGKHYKYSRRKQR